MNIGNVILDMCQLQDKLNKVIDNNWIHKRTLRDFYIAIHQEVAELIDTYPWKWWKHMKEDIENRKVELVDIWHFIMSYWMIEANNRGYTDYVKYAAKGLYDAYNMTSKFADSSVFTNITELSHYFIPGNNYYTGTLVFFGIIKNIFDDNFKEFAKLYYAKNILNIIRQEKGYKDGSYLKIINGLEDNQIMMKALNEIKDFNNFEEFKEKLIEQLSQ